MLNHRPVNVTDERRWLLGLCLLFAVPVVAAVGWFGVPAGTATVTVDTAAVDGPVDVTVGKPSRGDPLVLTERTLSDDGGEVYRTRAPQTYVVALETPDGRCSVDLGLTRTDGTPAWFTNPLVVEYVESCAGTGASVDVTVT